MSFIVIIPARFGSSRLPGKPLADINGKPMVIHVMERAYASGADRVIVATDHTGIVDVVKRTGGEVCLTHRYHQSGTARLGEVINLYGFCDDQIIVNIQGDEPLIPPPIIQQVVDDLNETARFGNISTLTVPISTLSEMLNPNIVKVVIDIHGYALYFSRSAIPADYEGTIHSSSSNQLNYNSFFLRHVGIYAYRASFIRRYINWPESPLEKIEMLEQLRILWYGEKIHVAMAKVNISSNMGVDTQEDLEKIRALQSHTRSLI